MTGSSLHPLWMVLIVIGIVTGLYTVYGILPVILPVLFGFSSLALLVRLMQIGQERRREKSPEAVIVFEDLRAKDFVRYVPWLKENVRGHDGVVDRLAAKIQQGLGVSAPHRTLGAFLLVGPTGTGKTFLGELAARALYPETEPLILRMNHYKDHEDVYTLVGPPPGQPGYEVGGALTRPVLENPYRVVILDEFDKCHPDVRHCFYDILDTAKCREKSSGRTVHFSACAFFATANTGVETIRAIWEDSADPLTRTGRAREALAREGFDRPLLARFDHIEFMDHLQPVTIAEVACLQLAKHWRQYGIEVRYASPEVLVEAVRRNVEFQDYGVRQLAHLIQELTTPSIEAVRRSGATRVRLDLDRSTGQVRAAAETGA